MTCGPAGRIVIQRRYLIDKPPTADTFAARVRKDSDEPARLSRSGCDLPDESIVDDLGPSRLPVAAGFDRDVPKSRSTCFYISGITKAGFSPLPLPPFVTQRRVSGWTALIGS